VILAAGLLVLVGLGLFVAGLATGTTLLYWATVVVCAIAAVLLVLSRRGMSGPATPAAPAEDTAGPRRSARTREVPAAGSSAEPSSVEPSSEPALGPAVDSAPAAVPPPARAAAPVEEGEPPLEEVEVTDLLLVVDLKDDVFVLDEHPRYHLAECPRLTGQDAIPLPLDEARTDGFTPCGICSPDRTMAERERARRAGRRTS
jgi:hypothetical protein